MRFQLPADALQALAARQGELIEGCGDKDQPAVAQLAQMLGQERACGHVAQLNGAYAQLVLLFPDEHRGQGVGDLLHQPGKAGKKRIDNAVHVRVHECVEVEFFQLRLSKGVAHDDAVIQAVGVLLNGLDDFGIVLIGQRGGKHQQHPGACLRAGLFAGGQVVVELLCGSEHALARFTAEGNFAAVIENQGYGGL